MDDATSSALAALADGTLGPEARDALLARIASSPELQEALRRQREGRAAVHGLATEASPVLRMTVAAMAAGAQPRRRLWRRRRSAPDGRVNFVGPQHDELAARRGSPAAPARPGGRRDNRRVFAGRRVVATFGAGVTALAAAAVLLAGAGPAGPSVAAAAQLALAAPSGAAPGVVPGTPERLTASVDGIAYPYWGDSAGWEAVGTRRDDLGGRRLMTVVYTNAREQRIGYAIASGTPLPVHDGTTVTRHGTAFRILRSGGATVVTWLRDGHTCILAAHGVGTSVLLDLASRRS